MPAATPDVLFNYLGRLPAELGVDWTPVVGQTPLSAGREPGMRVGYGLEINAVVREDAGGPVAVLHLSWPAAVLSDEAAADLAADLADALDGIARHVPPTVGRRVPSDFGLVHVSVDEIDEIDEIEASVGAVADLLPATPLQRGLYFHAMFDPDREDAYLVQQVVELVGPMDAVALRRAVAGLTARHEP
nr:hypothetical protein [Micromonospora sp. DSM 115978]